MSFQDVGTALDLDTLKCGLDADVPESLRFRPTDSPLLWVHRGDGFRILRSHRQWDLGWLYCELSVPKLLFGHNFNALTEDEFLCAIQVLEHRLLTAGVALRRPILDSFPYRIDLNLNIVLKREWPDYLAMLGKIQPGNSLKPKLVGDTQNFNNRFRKIRLYDKLAMLPAHLVSQLPPIVIRAEMESRRREKIARHLGIEMLGDLRGNFARLDDWFRGYLWRAVADPRRLSTATREDVKRCEELQAKIQTGRHVLLVPQPRGLGD